MQLLVAVKVEAKGLTVEVRVREKAPVITVMFRAAKAAGLSLTTNSALFEMVASLKLCEYIPYLFNLRQHPRLGRPRA